MVYMQSPVHIIDGIYLGGVPVLRQRDFLQHRCITHILKLFYNHEVLSYPDPQKMLIPALPSWLDELTAVAQAFTVFDTPLKLDAPILPEAFEQGINFLRNQVRGGNHALIFSRERTVRAPILAVAYLMEVHRYEMPDAVRLVSKLNRTVGFGMNPAPWQSLMTYFKTPYTPDDLKYWWSD